MWLAGIPQVILDVLLDVVEPERPVLVGDRVALGVERADHDLVAVAVADRDHAEVDVAERPTSPRARGPIP